jgi:hypothetical protein
MATARCAVRSFRSKPALAASIVLLLAFFFVTRIAIHWRSTDGYFARDVLNFLHPGYKHHPAQWLAIEGSLLFAGACGLALYGLALAGPGLLARLRTMPTVFKRVDWRPTVWVLLLGYLAPALLSVLSVIPDLGSSWRRGGLAQAMHFAGYVAPLGTLYCAARLLFGRRPWRADKWLGYITAAAALFGVSWKVIMFSGLGESLPFAGFFGARGAASAYMLLSLAVGIASAWTGLFLARNGAAALRGLRDFAVIGYLVLAASLFSVLLSKTAGLGNVLASLASQYTAPYLCLLTVFAAVVMLCLADGTGLLAGGARPTVPAETAPTPRSLFRRALAAPFTGRFLADFGLSFVITAVLLGIAYMTVGQTPLLAAAFMMPIIMFGFLIGPVVIFVIGVLRGRAGFAAAPVLILLAIFGFRYANLQSAAHEAQAAVDEAATLNVYPFAAPSRQHDIVVIEDSHNNREDGMCSLPCMQILVASQYAVALPDQASGEWRVYRRATGLELCRQPAQVKSYVALLAAGYVDTCIIITREAPRSTALVILENQSDDAPVKKLLPKGVRAWVPEIYERIDGQDRLLGRIVSGNVQPPLLAKQEPTETPVQMSSAQFYAEALKLPIGDAIPTTDAEMATVLSSLEDLFSDPDIGDTARNAFRNIGRIAKSEAGAAPLRAALERFWQSGDPTRVILGLHTVYSMQPAGAEFAKPAVARFMASDNVDVTKAAVHALNGYKADLEFAKAPLADLILSNRMAAFGNDARSIVDLLKKMPGAFPPEIRERAKAELAARPDLAEGRLIAVLAIVARGDAQNRQDLIDWVFSLEGEHFERVMSTLAFKYDVLSAPRDSVRFWSESDMEALIPRTATVSDAHIVGYIRAIQFQTSGLPLRSQLRDLVEARADRLANGSTEDQKLAKELRKILRRMDS